MSTMDRYDTAFLGILQNEGQIQEFLDVFFSFLYRRTDFFRHLISPSDKYGFRQGVAKKLVLNAFKKYESLAADKNKKLKEAYEKLLQEENAKTEMKEHEDGESHTCCAIEEPHMMVVNEEVVLAEEVLPHNQDDLKGSLSRQPDDATITKETTSENPACHTTTNTNESIPSSIPGSSCNENKTDDKAHSKNSNQSTDGKGSGGGDDDDHSELAKAQRIYQANPESYNGAMRDNYSWSQSISDLDIIVKVPSYVRGKKPHQLSVVVDKKHLKVEYDDLSGSKVVAVADELCWEVHRDNVVWSLVPGDGVHINLDKIQERWWDALLIGEEKISTRRIDPSRPITDLGDEEQAKVEEMMFNERQKRLGLPQSHEQKTHELLKKAWDAEGSPFKGQPFDPSKLNISTGGL